MTCMQYIKQTIAIVWKFVNPELNLISSFEWQGYWLAHNTQPTFHTHHRNFQFQSNCGNRARQKYYCESEDPPRRTHEYPKICVFYKGALSPISMSKRTLKYTFFIFPFWNSPLVQQWSPLVLVRFSPALAIWTLLQLLFNCFFQLNTFWLLLNILSF